MLTKNYPSCTSCHASPTGGGILTNYGRSQSGEILSTFNYEPLPEFPEWFGLGADIRWLNVSRDTKDYKYSKLFFMQTQAEVMLKPIKGLSIVATAGKYGEDDEYQYRRNYILLDVTDSVHFRAGRFNYAYGLNVADHTAFIHPGEGSEVYAFESHTNSRWYNLFATFIGGSSRNINGSHKGYELSEGEDGYALRGDIVFLSSSVGYSYSDYINVRRGPFASFSVFDSYILFQLDSGEEGKRFFSELGKEVYKGVTLAGGYQAKPKVDKFEAKINWFPVQHLELLFQYDYTLIDKQDFENQYLFMTHLYL